MTFANKTDKIIIATLHDKRIDRYFTVAFNETNQKFLTSSVGCSLEKNWSKKISKAAVFVNWEQIENVLKQNDFSNIKIDL